MACTCCVTYNSSIIVNDGSMDYDITNQTVSISVDTAQDIMWEDETDDECNPTGDYIYMYGPSKSTVQISAYPFTGYDDYTMGFVCPVNVSVQIPWRYVYDCRGCDPCIDPETGDPGSFQRRGRWVGIPQKKKTVQVTGDIEGVSFFSFTGCPTPIAKYTLTAGSTSVITPQPTTQYIKMQYTGQPISFDTNNLRSPFYITIRTPDCDWVTGFNQVKAYLTGFTFEFNPPQPPTVSYTFDTLPVYCLEC